MIDRNPVTGDAGGVTSRSSSVQVCPITDQDLDDVARFLGAHYPPDTVSDEWAEAWRSTVNLPGSQAPNHGFLIRADGRVAGAYLAIYSTRLIDGRLERFCNLAVFCTSPEYRLHSVKMLKAVLAQKGWHFTDLTPIEVVQKLNLRHGFTYIDTTTALVPNLPWPTLPGRVRVSSDPRVIESTLADPFRRLHQDHANCRWPRHLVLVRGEESCYVMWRMERRKNLPVFASIRYASNPRLLRENFGVVGRHLLLHHGALASLVETRISGGPIRPSRLLPNRNRRMFKSATLGPDSIDYLYSEITSAP